MSKKKTIIPMSVPAQASVLLDGKPYGIRAVITQTTDAPGGQMVTSFDIQDIWRINWDGAGNSSQMVREINADPYKYAAVCNALGSAANLDGKKDN